MNQTNFEPSAVLRDIKSYIRYRDETRKKVTYWLKQRYPKYGVSNGTVLINFFLMIAFFVSIVVIVYTQKWWPILIPLALWVANEFFVTIIIGTWRSIRSPSKKFKQFAPPKPGRNYARVVIWTLIALLASLFPKLVKKALKKADSVGEAQAKPTPKHKPRRLPVTNKQTTLMPQAFEKVISSLLSWLLDKIIHIYVA